MKSNASSNSFFLGFFIETRHSKKSISIGNRTRGQFLPVWQFSSCDSLPGTAYSSPGLEQWRSQTKAAHTAGERMLEVRAPPLTPGEVSGMGCAGPAFLGETSQGAASASTRVGIPRQEFQGLLQDGVHGALRPVGIRPLCCREVTSTKVSPWLRGSLHHSNLTPP